MTVILKIVKSPYLNEKSSAFGEMCTEEQMCNSMTVTWPNIEKKLKFRIDGGLPKRSVFGHNSTTDCPISVKLAWGSSFSHAELRQWDRHPHSTERISCFPHAVWFGEAFSYRLR